MYLYNGKSKFSTYCFWVIKNNIINYNRSQERQDVVEHHIHEIKQQVFDLQNQGITVEKAVSKLSSTDESVFGTIQKVQSSLLGESRSFQDGDERLLMWRAIEETQLSDLERNLVDNCISGNRGHIARMAETVVNPNTGKLYTKQRLSQIFIRACEKIRKTYRTKQRVAA
jgi:DNA-directed RNA polymerase specialized sigma subunit